jgi:hypothetical protein
MIPARLYHVRQRSLGAHRLPPRERRPDEEAAKPPPLIACERVDAVANSRTQSFVALTHERCEGSRPRWLREIVDVQARVLQLIQRNSQSSRVRVRQQILQQFDLANGRPKVT